MMWNKRQYCEHKVAPKTAMMGINCFSWCHKHTNPRTAWFTAICGRVGLGDCAGLVTQYNPMFFRERQCYTMWRLSCELKWPETLCKMCLPYLKFLQNAKRDFGVCSIGKAVEEHAWWSDSRFLTVCIKLKIHQCAVSTTC